MSMRRGFSLLEIMVVGAVVGISGSLAVMAMSDQMGSAKARSDEVGMFLRIKTERNRARERLQPLMIQPENEGHKLVFIRPEVVGSGSSRACVATTDVVGQAQFAYAALSLAQPPLPPPSMSSVTGPIITTSTLPCIDANGLPIGDFDFVIQGSDGRINTVTVNPTGQLEGSLVGKGGRQEQNKTSAADINKD